MDGIKEMCQKKLLADNEKIIYIIILGCGGVMFLKHFRQLTNTKDTKLIDKLADNGIIKIKQVGRNKVVIARYTAYCYLGLKSKSAKITSKHLLHSALLCEMLIHTYHGNIDKMIKVLKQSNFQYYSIEDSQNFINRVMCFMADKSANTSTLQSFLDEIKEKTEFLKSSTKGRKETLNKSDCQTSDLLILRNNSVYIHFADYIDGTLQIHIAIYQHQNNPDKLIRNIKKAYNLFGAMLYGIRSKIYIDVYSLNDKSEYTENKIFRQFPNENISFHWYSVKNRLFSGIDVEKWL